jgi:hypothetical protein
VVEDQADHRHLIAGLQCCHSTVRLEERCPAVGIVTTLSIGFVLKHNYMFNCGRKTVLDELSEFFIQSN